MASRLLTINMRDFLVNQPRRKRAMRVSSYVKGRVAHYYSGLVLLAFSSSGATRTRLPTT